MEKLSKEEVERGTVTVWMRRSSRRRIPRLLRIKKAVESGARLSNFQINFLSRVFNDAQEALPYFDRHPELHEIATKAVSLYHEITEQALKNEKTLLQKNSSHVD